MAIGDILRLTLNYKNLEEVLGSTFHYREIEAADRSIGAEELAKGFVAAFEAMGIQPVMPQSWQCHSVLVTYPEVEFANGWEELFILKGSNVNNSLPDINFAEINLLGNDAGGLRVSSNLQWSGIATSQHKKTRLNDAFTNAVAQAIAFQLLTIDSPNTVAQWEMIVPTRPNAPADRTIVPFKVTGVRVNTLIGARYDRKVDTPNTGRKAENGAPAAQAKKLDRSRSARLERRKKALELKEKGRQPRSKKNGKKKASGAKPDSAAE